MIKSIKLTKEYTFHGLIRIIPEAKMTFFTPTIAIGLKYTSSLFCGKFTGFESIDRLLKLNFLLSCGLKICHKLTLNKTTVVIAHRLSTILNSNNIYVIDSGKVVGNGKHEELLAKSEIYKNFHDKQIQR